MTTAYAKSAPPMNRIGTEMMSGSSVRFSSGANAGRTNA